MMFHTINHRINYMINYIINNVINHMISFSRELINMFNNLVLLQYRYEEYNKWG